MIERAWEAVDKAAVDELMANRARESKTLEYKLTLPGGSDPDKKEFLADVSSFANASGGDIIYGVKEETDASGKKTGLPEEVVPITDTTQDEATRRLEEMIRYGIDPRMLVQTKTLTGWDGGQQGFVLVLRIPRSLSAPHVVTYRDSFKFFYRDSASRHALDVDELRSAFLATESQAERIRRFREDRLARIAADETPVKLAAPERLVLHMVPLQSFLTGERFDLTRRQELQTHFKQMEAVGISYRYNLDGLLFWESESRKGMGTEAYSQLFFNGAVEAVDTHFVTRSNSDESAGTDTLILGTWVEELVLKSVGQYLNGLKTLDARPPHVIMVGVLGCRGAYMHRSSDWPMAVARHPIDRDALLLPDVMAEDFTADVAKMLKPVFDSLWNACGYPRSMNYDAQDNWNPKR